MRSFDDWCVFLVEDFEFLVLIDESPCVRLLIEAKVANGVLAESVCVDALLAIKLIADRQIIFVEFLLTGLDTVLSCLGNGWHELTDVLLLLYLGSESLLELGS